MSTFDERDHPRHGDGTFSEKPQSAPEIVLPQVGQAHESNATAEIVLPQAKDPFDYIDEFPTTKKHLFAGAPDFATIDLILRETTNAEMSETDVWEYRWGAVEAGRDLRRRGIAGVPSALPTEGVDGNDFAHAQNQTELDVIFDIATEEYRGSGQGWLRPFNESRNARLAELRAAGAVR